MASRWEPGMGRLSLHIWRTGDGGTRLTLAGILLLWWNLKLFALKGAWLQTRHMKSWKLSIPNTDTQLRTKWSRYLPNLTRTHSCAATNIRHFRPLSIRQAYSGLEMELGHSALSSGTKETLQNIRTSKLGILIIISTARFSEL